MPLLALLPSPLLGPAVWEPAVPALKDRQWDVVTTPAFPASTTSPRDVLDAYLAALPADREIVLVPHSNAGLFAPLIASARGVTGFVFVDAGLPPKRGAVPLAAEQQLNFLTGKADSSGILPPWTQWWDTSDTNALFPDAEIRTRIEREQLRLPVSYFEDTLQVPLGWDDRPSAYLSFGDTYAAQREDAISRGWAVESLPGNHLQMLADPVGVSNAIHVLLGQLGITPD